MLPTKGKRKTEFLFFGMHLYFKYKLNARLLAGKMPVQTFLKKQNSNNTKSKILCFQSAEDTHLKDFSLRK